MPWTQGEFKVPHNFVTEYNAGQKKIRADLVDENFTDIAGAVNKVVSDYKEADALMETKVNKAVEDATAIAGAAFIAGGIVPFSGTFIGRNPVPRGKSAPDTNWVLCDGGSDGYGGTVPDLRGCMIMGANETYSAGSKGGAATHTHTVTGNIGWTTLNASQTAWHSHLMFKRTPGNYQASGGPLASSTQICCSSSNSVSGSSDSNYSIRGDSGTPDVGATGASGTSAAHSHSLDTASAASSSNLPPYYALAYIIKVA